MYMQSHKLDIIPEDRDVQRKMEWRSVNQSPGKR